MLEEGGWDVVALEFYFVFVTPLDGGCEDGVDSEQKEVVDNRHVEECRRR